MLYILWALVNIALFIFFVVICFRAMILIRRRFGLLASVVFVFGILSFVADSNKLGESKTWELDSINRVDRNSTSFIDINLEDAWISKYELGIKYGKDREGNRNIPISATSWTIGLTSGATWKPRSIAVNSTDDNTQFEYSVNGVIEWELLGSTIYSQPKEYMGIASIK